MTSEWIITEGTTVEQASIAALDALGVAADDADIEVIAGARRGLLGVGGRAARVIARVQPVSPPARIERNNKRPFKRRAGNRNGQRDRSQATDSKPRKKTRRGSPNKQATSKSAGAKAPIESHPAASQPAASPPPASVPSEGTDKSSVRTRKLVS